MGDAGASMLGMAHPKANMFVQSIQNPFQRRVAAIVDPLGKLREAGTLTYAQAQEGQTKLETEIAAFQEQAKQFEGFGKEHAGVVAKARETLNPIIESWRAPFAKDLATLTPPEPPPAPTPPPPENPPGLTSAEMLTQATGAAEQQRKRALAARGRESTILTGPSGLMAISGANTQRKTLLGY